MQGKKLVLVLLVALASVACGDWSVNQPWDKDRVCLSAPNAELAAQAHRAIERWDPNIEILLGIRSGCENRIYYAQHHSDGGHTPTTFCVNGEICSRDMAIDPDGSMEDRFHRVLHEMGHWLGIGEHWAWKLHEEEPVDEEGKPQYANDQDVMISAYDPELSYSITELSRNLIEEMYPR